MAEFAIAVPVFLILLIGVIDFSRMLFAYVTVQHSAREAVRYAVTGREDIVDGDRLASIEQVADASASPLHSDPAVEIRSRQDVSVATFTENSAGGPCDQVEVEVTHEFHFLFNVIGISPTVTLNATERMISEAWDDCDL
jgi:Flp pilus assembly protein TadG